MIGKYYDVFIEDLKIGDHTILLSNRLKNLGEYFKSGRTFVTDNEITMRKFYAAGNEILQSC